MGRKKEVIYYKGHYKGKYLDDRDCDRLDRIRELSDKKGCVANLKNVIYELNSSEVKDIISAKSSDFLPEKKIGTLEDAQTVGVAYMFYAKKLVLGDSVGLGKTVEVCALMNLLKLEYQKRGYEFRFLYLTEKNILPQAYEEIIKFTGDYVECVQGVQKSVANFIENNQDDLMHSVVGSHSLINSQMFQEYILYYKKNYGVSPFNAIIVDESSVLGNTKTMIYSNAKTLFSDVEYKILLNATPFESKLDIFYAQLNFVDETFLPTKTEFTDSFVVTRFNGRYKEKTNKYKNAEVFMELVKYRYLARRRRDLGYKIENCEATLVKVGVSSLQRELLKRSSMPQMVIDCPSYYDKSIIMTTENCPKVSALVKLLTEDLADEKSVLVYSHYKESQYGIAEVLKQFGITYEILNGGSSEDERKSVIQRFKLGDFKVLITNVQKGLNFGNCNACIFYAYDSNPGSMVQFEGRMTRTKDIVGKKVYLIISKGKEYNTLMKEIKSKAEASDVFAGSDFSCILSLLINVDEGGNISLKEREIK